MRLDKNRCTQGLVDRESAVSLVLTRRPGASVAWVDLCRVAENVHAVSPQSCRGNQPQRTELRRIQEWVAGHYGGEYDDLYLAILFLTSMFCWRLKMEMYPMLLYCAKLTLIAQWLNVVVIGLSVWTSNSRADKRNGSSMQQSNKHARSTPITMEMVLHDFQSKMCNCFTA